MNGLAGLEASVEVLEQDLSEAADPVKLCRFLQCSPYEYQRLFSFVVGVPPAEYVKRRRLTEAGEELRRKGAKANVLHIAIRYGYHSHSAFSRAFKAFHGVTPSEARRMQAKQLNSYPRFALRPLIGGMKEMEYRMIELPPTRMARSGNHDLDEFDRWWSALAAAEKGVMFPKDFFWNNERTGQPEWLYTLPNEEVDTNGYEVFDFPGGTYAVTTTRDDDEDKSRAYAGMMDWLGGNELFEPAGEHNDPTYHSRYGMGHVSSPPGLPEPEFTIFVPIVRKQQQTDRTS